MKFEYDDKYLEKMQRLNDLLNLLQQGVIILFRDNPEYLLKEAARKVVLDWALEIEVLRKELKDIVIKEPPA